MEYVYKQIPVISKELFYKLKEISDKSDITEPVLKDPFADNNDEEVVLLSLLKKEVPGAQDYWTVFYYDGAVYNIESSGNKMERSTYYNMSAKENPIVLSVPPANAEKEVVLQHTGLSQEFFLRALAVTLHGNSNAVIDKSLPDYKDA